MTRDARFGFDSGLYDKDFFRWTQRQATALRSLTIGHPAGVSSLHIVDLDVANLAEEIADLGKRDLREVASYLDVVVLHLVKLRAAPAARDAAHWYAEVVNFRRAARRAFSPGMRQLLDIDDIWIGGCQAAGRFLQDHAAGEPSSECPFTLDDLLGPEFDVAEATGRISLG